MMFSVHKLLIWHSATCNNPSLFELSFELGLLYFVQNGGHYGFDVHAAITKDARRQAIARGRPRAHAASQFEALT